MLLHQLVTLHHFISYYIFHKNVQVLHNIPLYCRIILISIFVKNVSNCVESNVPGVRKRRCTTTFQNHKSNDFLHVYCMQKRKEKFTGGVLIFVFCNRCRSKA